MSTAQAVYCTRCDSEACVCPLGPTPSLRAVEPPVTFTESSTAQVAETFTSTNRRTRFTADELCATEFPPLSFAVPDLLPEGFTLLAGAPKLGKSFLSLGIAVAVASGGRALGTIPCDPAEALYLGLEDGPRRLKTRLQAMLKGAPPPRALTVDTEWPSIKAGAVDALEAWLADHPACRLVVIDVLARMRGTTSDKSDRYAADYQTVEVLKRVADHHGIALVCVHHTRKAQADDFLDAVSGTNGLAGAADSTLVLRRARTEAGAELHVTGRDVEERKLALSFSAAAGTWTIEGDAAEAALSPERREILDALRTAGVPLGPKDLAQLVSSSHDSLKHLLPKMAEAGQVKATGRGTYVPPSPRSPHSPGVNEVNTVNGSTGHRMSPQEWIAARERGNAE